MVMEAIRTGFETQTNDEPQRVEEKQKSKHELFVEQNGTQRAGTETIINLIKQTEDQEKRFENVKNVLDICVANMAIIEEQIENKRYNEVALKEYKESLKQGILAEVCVHLSLEKIGFKIHPSTVEEDLRHGIDMYAEAPAKYGEGTLFAIQIKKKSNIETVQVADLKRPKTHENIDFAMTNEQYKDNNTSEDHMLAYLKGKEKNPYTTHPEFEDNFYIRPALIVVPGGRVDISVFKRDGEPIASFPQQLEIEMDILFLKQTKNKPETPVRA